MTTWVTELWMPMRSWRRYDLVSIMNSVTVRFGPSSTSQNELLQELVRATRSLEKEGVLEDAKVEAVWPGDETAECKGAFVVRFYSSTPSKVADVLNGLPGVRNAYVAPSRSAY